VCAFKPRAQAVAVVAQALVSGGRHQVNQQHSRQLSVKARSVLLKVEPRARTLEPRRLERPLDGAGHGGGRVDA